MNNIKTIKYIQTYPMILVCPPYGDPPRLQCLGSTWQCVHVPSDPRWICESVIMEGRNKNNSVGYGLCWHEREGYWFRFEFGLKSEGTSLGLGLG